MGIRARLNKNESKANTSRENANTSQFNSVHLYTANYQQISSQGTLEVISIQLHKHLNHFQVFYVGNAADCVESLM